MPLSDKAKKYEGDALVVEFSLKRCIHAERCIQGLPAVFRRDQRPWVDPDGAAPDEVAAVIRECPTGALQYVRLDGQAGEEPPQEATVTPTKDGPLYVRGDIRLHGPDGVREMTRVALCRCGASKNKPYCDNMHRDHGFADEGIVGTPENVHADPVDGTLDIEPLPDGPVLFRGKLTIESADGAATCSVTEGAFCRCGGSTNKPFCDGTHAKIGFASGASNHS